MTATGGASTGSGATPANSVDSVADVADRVRVALSGIQIHGLTVTVNREGIARLEGTVRTELDFENAQRLAIVPGVAQVLNALDVDPLVGSMPIERTVLSPELAAEIELNDMHFATSVEEDFNNLVGTTDPNEAASEAEPYFAPTDPPVRRAPRDAEGIEVVGGFSPTSDTAPIDFEQRPAALLTGDDEIARLVRLALMEDATTTDLPIWVTVHRGVVHLRGTVPSLNDAEAAEDVASRVPNVVEVNEELDVPGV